ncbi:hypothetical protein [Geotalea sp. SG265]|uniref:hypothetical protein n=1 Tax=Geotalea sp. SG265 TaxID=2922867 RepID=UPI001FAF8448|nr:hypothetical protein [Geotalea sp. SG265]
MYKSGIINLLIKHDKTDTDLSVTMFEDKVQLVCFVSSGILFLFLFICFYMEWLRHYQLLICMISLLLMLVHNLSVAIHGLLTLFNPIKSYLTQVKERISSEVCLLKKLEPYSIEAVDYTCRRLIHEKKVLEDRVGFIVGAMDKLGIIPAVILLYLTYAKNMDDPTLHKAPNEIIVFVGTIYFVAFVCKHVIDRLNSTIFILEEAKKSKETKAVEP